MAHVVHCRLCKHDINKDNLDEWIMPSKNWYYHKACYEDFVKKKGRISEGDLTVEADDDTWFNHVYEYLTKELKMPVNFIKFKSQWTNFLADKKNPKTAKGIYWTLRYFYDIQHGDPSKSENGIGIVSHIYKEGTEYWGARRLRDQNICAQIEQQIRQLQQQPTVVIKQERPKKAAVRADIDLDDIVVEDDE